MKTEMAQFTQKLEDHGLSEYAARDGDFAHQYQELKKSVKEHETKMMMMEYTVEFQNELFDKYIII